MHVSECSDHHLFIIFIDLIFFRLWEIVASLKNFGKGRMVIPNRYKRYPEPTYYRILEARPDMDPVCVCFLF